MKYLQLSVKAKHKIHQIKIIIKKIIISSDKFDGTVIHHIMNLLVRD